MKGDLGSQRTASFALIPGKVLEKIILEAIAKHMKGKKVPGSSHQSFTKKKSSSSKPVSFYHGRIVLAGERSAVNVVYLKFSKAFDNFSHNILIGKLMKHRPNKWPVRCAEKWLNCWV